MVTGSAPNLVFTRKPNHDLQMAERVIEVTSVLKNLGFKPHEVKAAVEQTKTHVGREALTTEQWVRIALGKCPKPRS